MIFFGTERNLCKKGSDSSFFLSTFPQVLQYAINDNGNGYNYILNTKLK